MTWKINILKKTAIKKPIFIEGLPGIGNVGKLAIDFIVDDIKATKIADLFSYTMHPRLLGRRSYGR